MQVMGKCHAAVASCLHQFGFPVSSTSRGQCCNRILFSVPETNFILTQGEMKMEVLHPSESDSGSLWYKVSNIQLWQSHTNHDWNESFLYDLMNWTHTAHNLSMINVRILHQPARQATIWWDQHGLCRLLVLLPNEPPSWLSYCS